MKFLSRIPVAFGCLALGGFLAILLNDRLHGQAVPPLAIPKELGSYRDVVKHVLPAVVSIEAKATKRVNNPRLRQLPNNVPEEFRRFFEGMDQEQPLNPNLGFGSGVVIDAGGVILTNFHVVDGADTLEVAF